MLNAYVEADVVFNAALRCLLLIVEVDDKTAASRITGQTRNVKFTNSGGLVKIIY